jgi:hypothetical protein
MVQKNHPPDIPVTLKLPAEILAPGTVDWTLSGFSARLVHSECRALIWQPEVAICSESKRVAPKWVKIPDTIAQHLEDSIERISKKPITIGAESEPNYLPSMLWRIQRRLPAKGTRL